MEGRDRKLREAKRLRTRRAFPMSLFSDPDYDASAELFADVGNVEEDVDRKISCYEEAARTYLMGDGEYSRYQASQMYEKIGQLCEETDAERAVEGYRRAGMLSRQCGRESIAATSFQKVADILRMKGDLEGCLESLRTVADCYRGGSWKHHRMKAAKDVAGVCVELRRFGEAARLFESFGENASMFCAFLCYAVDGTACDLEIGGDERVVCDALERGTEEASRAIDEYVSTHAMGGDVRQLLGIVRERLKPEHDIL